MSEPTNNRLPVEHIVRWVGLIGAPVAAVVVYLALGHSTLSDPARATAAIGTLMAIFWMTEALPLPVTSLLPIVLFPLFAVHPITENGGAVRSSQLIRFATAPYANELIFLFMGGFMLALAMERWGLHKRIALQIVSKVGTRPRRLIGGFMLAAAFLSMWISNTATTLMMLPIGISLIALVDGRLRNTTEDKKNVQRDIDNFAICMMLGLAYAASIGGVATIIGTPPNLFLIGYLKETFNIEIGFGRWMLIGVPFSTVFLVITWLLLTRVLHPVTMKQLPGQRDLIGEEMRKLGPTSRGEKLVALVFVMTALLWMFRQPIAQWSWLVDRAPLFSRLTDPGIAMMAAVLLFAIPVDLKKRTFLLDWETAVRLPWGVLILFGGGLSLAKAVTATGLDSWIGLSAHSLGTLPTIAMVLAVVTVIIFLTELTSNTATATTFLPILGGVAIGIGQTPTVLVIPAAIAASCAFMMPVATPPNAIVFGSGRVRIGQMMFAGVWLNLIGVGLITLLAFTIERWALTPTL